MKFPLIAMLLLVLASAPQVQARRTSSAVRQERSRTARTQTDTRRRLQANAQETERQLHHLEELQAQIEATTLRERAVARRVDSISSRVSTLSDSLERLSAALERTRSDYHASLVAIRRQRQAASPLAFIFASQSFEQALRRARYLRDLADWNKRQGRLLQRRQAEVDSVLTRLEATRRRLANNRAVLERERRRLEQDRAGADALIAELRGNSRHLNQVLENNSRRMAALDRELNEVIEAEEAEARAREEAERRAREEAERRAREEAERRAREEAEARAREEGAGRPDTPAAAPARTQQPAPPRPQQRPQNTQPLPSAAELTRSFVAAKGRLPLPVDGEAMIVSNFGRRTHTEYSRVEVQNNGIDISARPGAKVRAVHAGVVSMVILMDGFQNVVLVRHGEYLTVYAGLATLSVRKGDTVQAGAELGTIYTPPTDDHGTRLHFEVRHEKEKLDPREWLRP